VSNFTAACSEAPAAQAIRDQTLAAFGGTNLGIKGDDAHCGSSSSHNCGRCGQESPVNGVAYHGGFAHAWDWGHGNNPDRYRIADRWRADKRTRYVIVDGRVLFGHHYRGGSGSFVGGHVSHWHISLMPGTHNETSPWYQDQADPKAFYERLARAVAAADAALERPRDWQIKRYKRLLGVPRGFRHSKMTPAVKKRIMAFQAFMGIRRMPWFSRETRIWLEFAGLKD
jgi:hypothetical protein